MKKQLLAMKVKADIEHLMCAAVDVSSIVSCLEQISPYRMSTTDEHGNQVFEEFDPRRPILSEIDEAIFCRLNWCAQVWTEDILLHLLRKGKDQVSHLCYAGRGVSSMREGFMFEYEQTSEFEHTPRYHM